VSRVVEFLRARTIYALIMLLALFVLGVELVRPGTVTPLWASNTLLFAAPLAIMAAGQTMVMLTGGIDLSVASVATGSAYLLATNASSGNLIAIGLGLLLGLIVGIANGVGVALLGVQPLVMTLGAGLMTSGVMIVYGQRMMASTPHVPAIIQTLGAGKVFGLVPVDLFLWIAIAALVLFGLHRTGFGRLLYAVGDNREACHLAGIRVWRVLFADYLFCAILAAITGLVLVGGTNAADLSLADGFLLPSVAAVVIGGTSIFGGCGGYAGTIVGALILTVLTGLLTLLDVSEPIKQILYGAIILSLAAAYARLTESSSAGAHRRSVGSPVAQFRACVSTHDDGAAAGRHFRVRFGRFQWVCGAISDQPRLLYTIIKFLLTGLACPSLEQAAIKLRSWPHQPPA
jgi:ribose transport system permease protein